ncbi:hypothetical protein [Staphylococcus aureus]|uniref:hypothetical protein n=1 Tax=Staphylococcus aureus TaxID=1280 RepID=UPI003F5B5868
MQKTTTTKLIEDVGSLWFGDPNLPTTEGGINPAEKTMDQMGIPYKKLTKKQIENWYQFKNLPESYVGFFQKDGGGYHAWYTGINVKEVMKEIRKPYFNENIYIVGEAYSSDQGWTEGAFKTAENMLQDHFQLNWPDWLEKEYYLGW